MGRKFRGIMTGLLGVSMLLGSMGAAGAQSGSTDYEGHWAQKTIETWLEKGDLKGFQDGSVKPNQSITRAEFMTLVNRAFAFTAESKISFADVASTNWAYSEVAKAVAAGYIQGYNNDIRPGDPINRQEAAVVVGKLLKLAGGNINDLKMFSDAGQIAEWGKSSVAAAVAAGILKGYPNGTFAPQQALTRAESLTLIDSAAAQYNAVQPTATPAASATPSASPTPTATAAAAVGGGGGGGGGSGSVTATPTPTATPAVSPTAAPVVTPEPTLPVSDIPLLDIHVASVTNTSVTNGVYLNFDYSALPASMFGNGTYATYYVTTTPINSRDLKWVLQNRRALTTSPTYSYPNNSHVKVDVPSVFVPAAGDYYVSVILNAHDQTLGYYSQKVNLQPAFVSVSKNFVKLETGVTIKQEKVVVESNPSSMGGTYYSDVVDVTYALRDQPGNAVYYTISPKYYMNNNFQLEVDALVRGSHNLYTDKVIRLTESTSLISSAGSAGGTGDIPLVLATYGNDKTYNEQEYTIIFYNKDLQALSYYQGKVTQSDELAVETAEKKIDEIWGKPVLEEESVIMRASRAYSLLSDSLKAQISQSRKTTLENALSQLEIKKSSGPLGSSLPLASTKINPPYMTFNGSILTAYTVDPISEAESISLYITDSPITAADLAVPSVYGKQKFHGYDYLPVTGVQGNHYATVVLYDKNSQPIRYATQQVEFTVTAPVWDGSAVQIKDGVSLERDYNNGSRADYVIFEDYKKAHPEAVYATTTSRSELGTVQDFRPENVVKHLNAYSRTSSYPFIRLSYETEEALTGLTEDYIIIFYDQNFKAISYYIGTLAD
ncbi:S-layer homology domain-containing protein [Paenibacillus tianjinensis]|uniref:S-layer homology domain-containing protein n=1 Tax=Paenibacillus tianjinensis TaxID=2810347 RepID=A0ABX7LF13_9BACL|nr:S-layer homology domain-containing protein [Paenibacillus tianjinensis]QSF45448.1 S-layer homology domain-containing protein [Paenibacillus tianjinensis]